MRKATPEEKQALEALLSKAELDLVRIKRRLVFLDAILRELHRQTKTQGFTVRNDVVWQMVWDCYQMAIIDLATFARALVKEGGFFARLKNYVIQLRPGIHKQISRRPVMHINPPTPETDRERIERELDEHQRGRLKQVVAESLAKLFPGLGNEARTSQREIEELKGRLYREVKSLLDERDKVVAHRWEEGREDDALNANLDGLRTHFKAIEDVLSGIRMVAFAGQFSFEPPTFSNVERVATDLVDQILLGSINDVVHAVGMSRPEGELRHYWQFRKRYVPDFQKAEEDNGE
jgi:hypothetical protein